MASYRPSALPNTRIDVADVLRGIAIGGIVLIHFIEHLNFYDFPEPVNEFWASVNSGVWDTVFFLLAGKMYAVFALLFGLSMFIQHDNQAQRGVDFRPRFAWRMVLLMGFGLLDLAFFNGDILFLYAVCGLLVLPLIRASDRVIAMVAFFFMLQPIEIASLIVGAFSPDAQPLNLGSGAMFRAIMPAQRDGSLLDVACAGLRYGVQLNITWSIEHGRMTQVIFLFLTGIMIGRKRLFYNEGDNLKVWKRVLLWSCAALAVILPLYNNIPGLYDSKIISKSLTVMLEMWRNLAMMSIIVSGIVLLFYKTGFRRPLMTIAPYGKMSLTHYIGQSVVGSMLFYGWGFGLYNVCGHTVSLLMGFAFVVIQCLFSHWWLRSHKRGPLEQLWHNATWLKRA
ncbi:MAG: DUF418 domain-containing protein [Bacteroidales bacterium]|nr:DUF418 domain-containing protein [Bacteroidales bacterium]